MAEILQKSEVKGFWEITRALRRNQRNITESDSTVDCYVVCVSFSHDTGAIFSNHLDAIPCNSYAIQQNYKANNPPPFQEPRHVAKANLLNEEISVTQAKSEEQDETHTLLSTILSMKQCSR